jgi:hypothetical protein
MIRTGIQVYSAGLMYLATYGAGALKSSSSKVISLRNAASPASVGVASSAAAVFFVVVFLGAASVFSTVANGSLAMSGMRE